VLLEHLAHVRVVEFEARLDKAAAFIDAFAQIPQAWNFAFLPDGNLYVSNVGFGPPPIGLGQVLKITVPQN